MTQIIPSDFDIAAEESAEFVPMRGVANPHLQTMLPRLIRRKVQFTPHWQRLDLPDGDFLISPGAKIRIGPDINPVWWCFTVWKAACTALTHTDSLRRRKPAAGLGW